MQDQSTTLSVLDSLISAEPELNQPDVCEPATMEEVPDIPGCYHHYQACVLFIGEGQVFAIEAKTTSTDSNGETALSNNRASLDKLIG